MYKTSKGVKVRPSEKLLVIDLTEDEFVALAELPTPCKIVPSRHATLQEALRICMPPSKVFDVESQELITDFHLRGLFSYICCVFFNKMYVNLYDVQWLLIRFSCR